MRAMKRTLLALALVAFVPNLFAWGEAARYYEAALSAVEGGGQWCTWVLIPSISAGSKPASAAAMRQASIASSVSGLVGVRVIGV